MRSGSKSVVLLLLIMSTCSLRLVFGGRAGGGSTLGMLGALPKSTDHLQKPDVRSPFYLVALTQYERDLYNRLTYLKLNYQDYLPADLRRAIRAYLQKYYDEIMRMRSAYSKSDRGMSGDDGLIISQNPLLSLNMVWRFANDLKILRNLILEHTKTSAEGGPNKAFVSAKAFQFWPDAGNVAECMVALLRVQMVYDLDSEELAEGKIFGVETGARLDAVQCYQLGRFASEKEQYTLAVPWLELALKKVKTGEIPSEKGLRVSWIQAILDHTIEEHNRAWLGKRLQDHYFYTRQLKSKDTDIKNTTKRVPIRRRDHTALRRVKSYTYNDYNFWSLCSGENHQTEEEKSELYCWYERKSCPVLYIFPLKTEMLSKAPYIIQIYDVISNSTMAEMMSLAKTRLARSRIVDAKNPGRTVESHVRTSVSGWFDEAMPKLSRLIEAITGLSVLAPRSSERYLSAYYTFGGHYECHLDSFNNPEEFGGQGNRIATMMFYFENTQKGGRTVFPQAGTAATPVRGSGVFWYNLKRNGAPDKDTCHCACPVVLGHKTISTKWIRSDNQFNRRKCSLNPDE